MCRSKFLTCIEQISELIMSISIFFTYILELATLFFCHVLISHCHCPDLHPREIQNKLNPKPKTYRAHEQGGGHIFSFLLQWLRSMGARRCGGRPVALVHGGEPEPW
jgi:hypothetical protein